MDPLVLFRIVFGVLMGLTLGSFATVLVARVPGGESIGGRSICRSCGTQIREIDNIPLISWLLLRGRCRACGASIGWRYPLLEATSAALGAYVMAQPFEPLVTVAWMMFVPAAVALAAIDLEHKRLPDFITLRYFGLALVVLIAEAAWHGWLPLRGALIGAVALSGFYLLLNLVSRGGMGMGDVKLALSIGLLTGWFGWAHTVGATFLGFLAGSIVSVVLLVAGRATRKTAVPFGPFMLLGTFAVLPVAGLFSGLWVTAG